MELPLVGSIARRNRSCSVFAQGKCIHQRRLKLDGVPSAGAREEGRGGSSCWQEPGEAVSLSSYAVKSCAPLTPMPALGPLQHGTKTVQTLPLPGAISCRNVQVGRRAELSPRSWQRQWTAYLQIPLTCKISILRSLSWHHLPCNIYSLLHEAVNFKWQHAENMQFIYFNVLSVCGCNENVCKYMKYLSFIAIFTNVLAWLYICTHCRWDI